MKLAEFPLTGDSDDPLIYFKYDTKHTKKNPKILFNDYGEVISNKLYDHEFPYQRDEKNNIIINSVAPQISIDKKIFSGDKLYSVGQKIISEMTDDEIVDSFTMQDGNIIEIIDKKGKKRKIFIEDKYYDIEKHYIAFALYPISFNNINPVEGTFSSSYKINYSWVNNKLLPLAKGIYKKIIRKEVDRTGYTYFCDFYDQASFDNLNLWRPIVKISNEIEQIDQKIQYQIEYHPCCWNFEEEIWEENFDQHYLEIKAYIKASGVFSNKFVFNSFPFDSQELKFVVSDEAMDVYNKFEWWWGKYYSDHVRNFEKLWLSDWSMFGFDASYKTRGANVADSNFTETYHNEDLVFSYYIERNFNHFLFKIAIPILIILIISWSIFWIRIRELESRLTVSVVCFLSLIAYTFVIDKSLPKLDYLTIMDRAILMAYLFSAFPIISSVFAYRLYEKDPDKAVVINSYLRKALPLIFFISVVGMGLFVIYGSENTVNSMSLFK